jgi:hypothetical protein
VHRLLYIEDYFEDLSHNARIPWWLSRVLLSLSRTFGEAGDFLAFY